MLGSPLELAISVQNYGSAIALLNLGADPNAHNHMPSLHVAASLRDSVAVLLLLAYGALPNTPGGANSGYTALRHADRVSAAMFLDNPRSEVVGYEHLVSDAANIVNVSSDQALGARVNASITLLLHFGAQLEARDAGGDTALVQAVRSGDFNTADFLLSMGADIEAKDNNGNNLLLQVEAVEARKWCVEHGLAVGSST